MPQKFRYNGLKTRRKAIVARRKAHTFKVKAIIHYKTQKILSLCTSRGAVHDFELFKRNLNQIHVGVFILADKGYQRIYTVYPNSLLPLKAKKQKSKKAKKQKSKKAKKHCKLYPELK
ncbi:transposase, partial [Acinetobacter baumannii]